MNIENALYKFIFIIIIRVDLSAPLMHDPSDLGSVIQIQITPRERTQTHYSKSGW